MRYRSEASGSVWTRQRNYWVEKEMWKHVTLDKNGRVEGNSGKKEKKKQVEEWSEHRGNRRKSEVKIKKKKKMEISRKIK